LSISELLSDVHALKFDKSQLMLIVFKKFVHPSVSVLATKTNHPLGIEFFCIVKYQYSHDQTSRAVEPAACPQTQVILFFLFGS
jgi:hypothetical protein